MSPAPSCKDEDQGLKTLSMVTYGIAVFLLLANFIYYSAAAVNPMAKNMLTSWIDYQWMWPLLILILVVTSGVSTHAAYN